MSQTTTTACIEYPTCRKFDTTIKVRNTTRDRLAKRGLKTQTYDMIIVELLNELEVKEQ
jgi:hypothetical protein